MTAAVFPERDLACGLCAEPCPEGETFCCIGCRNVYAILRESGAIQEGQDPRETDLFQRSLALGLVSGARRSAAGRHVPAEAMVEEKLYHLSGMWCGACGWLIEHVLGQESAIRQAEVFFTSDLLRVRYCPQYLPASRIEDRIRELGYRITPHTGEARDDSAERRRELLRLGLAAFLWLNVMTLNLSVYLGNGLQHTLPYVVMALATPVVFWCGIPILRVAWLGLRQGVARMETLLAIGITAAFTYSVAEVFRGGRHIYFDIACAIVTLVLLGRFVERGAKAAASKAITGLYHMLPVKARTLVAGRERFVAIDALRTDEIFIVKAGERIPADGIVTDGESWVDESVLTGESRPVARQKGERVTGGSLNTGGILHVRATAVGSDSVLARIVRSVEAALSRRSEIERTVDRVSRIFVPSVLVLALLVGLFTVLAGANPGDALLRAITVLVIACPCALGIATPLAISAAVGAASRRGILIPDPKSFELAQRMDTVVLDKTGTVTEGRFELLEFNPADLPLLAAMEAYSEHPLGRAVVAMFEKVAKAGDVPGAHDVEIVKGQGIIGTVGEHRVFCGNRRLIAELGLPLPDETDAAERQGHTVAFYGWDGQVRGSLVFGDRIREDAPALIASLKRRGMRVLLVSGDSAMTVAAVAAAIGADEYHAEVLPEGKRRFLADLKAAGRRVVMVGDGVNDGPALAEADLGIAMGSGADLAMKASNVVLMTNQLNRITDVFDLARRTLLIIRQNLFWAFAYNVAGISFAALGHLNPILGAGAMVTSSLFVAWNSSRLRRF